MAGLSATYCAVVLTTVVASGFLRVGPDWFNQAATPEDVIRRIVLPEAFAGTVALSIVLRLGWRRGCGFIVPPWRPGLLVGLLPVCLLVVAAIGLAFRGFSSAQAGYVPTLLVGQLMVGFNEETASRGILLYGLERLHGRRFALILSSALFGLTHLATLAFGASLGESLRRVLAGTILGLILGVVRLRTGSIWFPVAIHGLWNFTYLGRLTIPQGEIGPLGGLPFLAVFGALLIAGLLRLLERVLTQGRRELVGTGAGPDVPPALVGPELGRWWRSLSFRERRELLRSAARKEVGTDPDRAAQLVGAARLQIAPGTIAAQLAFYGALALLLVAVPIPLSAKVPFLLLFFGWTALGFASQRRRMREAERLNQEALDSFMSGERPIEPVPASWETLGSEPRTYTYDNRFAVADRVLTVLIFASLLFVVSGSSGLARTVFVIVGAGLAAFMARHRHVRADVTLSPEWVEFARGRKARRWRWNELTSVRHEWILGATSRLTIVPPDGLPLRAWSSSQGNFDELVALVLSSVPPDRVDRRSPGPIDTLLWAAHVPTAEEGARPRALPQARHIVRALAIRVLVFSVVWVNLVAVARILSGAFG